MPKLQNFQIDDSDFLADVQNSIEKVARNAARHAKRQENSGSLEYWKEQKQRQKTAKSWDHITDLIAVD